MAKASKKKAGKSSKKTAKKVGKKVAKKTASGSARRKTATSARKPALTTAARAALTHPPTNYDDVIERFVRIWREEGAGLKAPGLSATKLVSLLTKAQRAQEREERVRAANEQRLTPLSDARMIAQDAAWRSLLDAWAMARAQTRLNPELRTAFAFMQDVFTGGGKREAAPEPDEREDVEPS